MAEPRWFKYYGRLPVWSQNVACSMMGLRMRRDRFNSVFRDFLAFAEEFQWRSLEQQSEYQNEKVREMIRHGSGDATIL